MLNLRALFGGKTAVFGHRGARAYAPMNTLPSFELALAQGAHGLELDVHRSKDGAVVVIHDFAVDATTNGGGIVSEMTLAELKALDAGSWFSSDYAGVQIPTLDEVFEAVGQRTIVNVEIKSLFTDATDGVEQAVAECILRHGMGERVFVSSFNPYTLLRFRGILPEVAIGVLHDKLVPVDTFGILGDTAYEAFHPQHTSITPEMVQETHAQGRVLNTWTVNAPTDAQRLQAWGVDCIITDKPDVILDALEGGG